MIFLTSYDRELNMINCRGSCLRAPTLQIMRGISRVQRRFGAFFDCMIQRIAARLLLTHNNKPLLLRRSDGRQTILGKYELPGGRIFADEQPEDALKRYLSEDLGIEEKLKLELQDVITYTDADDRDIQYAIIVYTSILPDKKRAIHLSQHYNKYIWYDPRDLPSDKLTGFTQSILGLDMPVRLKNNFNKSSTPLVYTDGGSRGNPGLSASGFVLVDETGTVVRQGGEFLGVTTNNQAEYQGVKLGLEAALDYGWRVIECRIDSMLVVNQLNGLYTIKNRELWPVYESVKELISKFEKVKFVHIPRELNQLADGMVNKTLDEEKRARYTKKQQLARQSLDMISRGKSGQ